MTEARLIEIAQAAREPISPDYQTRSFRTQFIQLQKDVLLLVGEVFRLRALIVRQREAA